MRNILFRGLTVFAGFGTLPSSVADFNYAPARISQKQTTPTELPEQDDSRLYALQRFFNASQCPLASLSMSFLREADTNGLDWRLLPSLSFVESGGGKAFR